MAYWVFLYKATMQLKDLKLFSKIALGIIKKKSKQVAILSVIFAAAFWLLGKYGINSIIPNTLTEGIIGTYQEHDLPDFVTNLLSDPLIEISDDGRPTPKLVSGWETNNDASVFKFKLRDNLYWTDQTTVKSSDLEFSLSDVEVSYPDDKTIQFKLKGSFSPFPTLLTRPVFKKGTLLGTGPYSAVKLEKSQVFITKLVLSTTRPNLPQITVRFYPNEKTAKVAFELGEIQSILGVNEVSGINGSKVAKGKKVQLYSKVVALLYNTKDPVLSNRSLRQALSYISPKIEGELLAKTSISPTSWSFSDKDINQYLENEQGAKEALGRTKQNNPDILKKEIILTTTPQLESVGKQVITSWEKLGIKGVLRIESGIPQNFQALLITQSIPKDPDQYSLWHSTQTKTNLTGYSQARVDKDLEDGRRTLNEEERKAKYQDFQKTLSEDAPATFLYFPKMNIIFLKKAESNLNKVLTLQLNPYL